MNIKQETLIPIIRSYLLKRGRTELANSLSPGYCHAFSLLFCYFAATKKLDQFYSLLKKVSEFKEDTTIQSKEPLEDPDIEKLLNFMEWMQRQLPRYYSVESDVNKINIISDTGHGNESFIFKEKADFEAAAIVPEGKILDILNACPLERPIILSTGRHTVALYRDGNGFKFYDSNDEEPKPYYNAVELLMQMNFLENAGSNLPLSLYILSQKDQAEWNKEELTRIFDDALKNIKKSSDDCSPSHYPSNGMIPLSLAILGHLDTTTNHLLNQVDTDLKTCDGIGLAPIHYAAHNQSHDIVKKLLASGVNVNQKVESTQVTNLIEPSLSLFKSISSATPLYFACAANDLAMVKLLVENGADINACSDFNVSPLAIAAIKGHKEIVDYLLTQHANVDIKIQTQNPILSKTNSAMLPLEYFGAIDELQNYQCLNPLHIGAIAAMKKEPCNTQLALHFIDLNKNLLPGQSFDNTLIINDKTLLEDAIFRENEQETLLLIELGVLPREGNHDQLSTVERSIYSSLSVMSLIFSWCMRHEKSQSIASIQAEDIQTTSHKILLKLYQNIHEQDLKSLLIDMMTTSLPKPERNALRQANFFSQMTASDSHLELIEEFKLQPSISLLKLNDILDEKFKETSEYQKDERDFIKALKQFGEDYRIYHQQIKPQFNF